MSGTLDPEFTNIFFKPLAPYLNNPDTSEVMVNAHDDIWVEDSKGVYKIPETFSLDALDAAVKALAQYIGRPITDHVYSIDARMPDQSRVCIMLPPVSGESPAFSIRLFKSVISDLGYLIEKGSLTQEMVELISALVKIKKNILVAGGTSSGKTTLLNLIAATIPNEDRIITIEDSKELQLKQDHILSLEAKPADKNGNGAFSIRDCLKSTLRLRPDRIVVGEIRGGEAFDLIQAMNTGHGGCMGTIHANNALETLKRMESIALMADIDIPLVALRSMLASSVDIIISPARMIDRSRKVVQIAEVGPLNEKGEYQVYDIARFVSTNYDSATQKLSGYFEFTGHVPTFFNMFAAEGVKISKDFFKKRIVGKQGDAKIPKDHGKTDTVHEQVPAMPQQEEVQNNTSEEKKSGLLGELPFFGGKKKKEEPSNTIEETTQEVENFIPQQQEQTTEQFHEAPAMENFQEFQQQEQTEQFHEAPAMENFQEFQQQEQTEQFHEAPAMENFQEFQQQEQTEQFHEAPAMENFQEFQQQEQTEQFHEAPAMENFQEFQQQEQTEQFHEAPAMENFQEFQQQEQTTEQFHEAPAMENFQELQQQEQTTEQFHEAPAEEAPKVRPSLLEKLRNISQKNNTAQEATNIPANFEEAPQVKETQQEPLMNNFQEFQQQEPVAEQFNEMPAQEGFSIPTQEETIQSFEPMPQQQEQVQSTEPSLPSMPFNEEPTDNLGEVKEEQKSTISAIIKRMRAKKN